MVFIFFCWYNVKIMWCWSDRFYSYVCVLCACMKNGGLRRSMEKKRKRKRSKRRNKVNFSEVRYPKVSMSKAQDSVLPDEIFWPVYYGADESGIVNQFEMQMRWHAIQMLEGGFEGDAEGLLHSRQVLTGMMSLGSAFVMEHQAVLTSAAFFKRRAEVNGLPFGFDDGVPCEWKSRANRAILEYGWCNLNAFKQFHVRMGFSSVYLNDQIIWLLLQVDAEGQSDIASRVSTAFTARPWYEVLKFKDALVMVNECYEKEMDEIVKLGDASDKDWQVDCIIAALHFFHKRRVLYTTEQPQIVALEAEKGHTNFGLAIDIYNLTEEKILEFAKELKKH